MKEYKVTYTKIVFIDANDEKEAKQIFYNDYENYKLGSANHDLKIEVTK